MAYPARTSNFPGRYLVLYYAWLRTYWSCVPGLPQSTCSSTHIPMQKIYLVILRMFPLVREFPQWLPAMRYIVLRIPTPKHINHAGIPRDASTHGCITRSIWNWYPAVTRIKWADTILSRRWVHPSTCVNILRLHPCDSDTIIYSHSGGGVIFLSCSRLSGKGRR